MKFQVNSMPTVALRYLKSMGHEVTVSNSFRLSLRGELHRQNE